LGVTRCSGAAFSVIVPKPRAVDQEQFGGLAEMVGQLGALAFFHIGKGEDAKCVDVAPSLFK